MEEEKAVAKEEINIAGRCCQEEGCRQWDFLPFHCPLCDHIYCLQHRSRFTHSCNNSSTEEEQATPNSASIPSTLPRPSELLAAVEHRFDSEDTHREESKHHFRVRATASAQTTQPSLPPTTLRILESLDKISSRSLSNKSRNINEQTRRMLIKSRAVGKESISQEDRLYLQVYCNSPSTGTSTSSQGNQEEDEAGTSLYIFVSKHSTLGESLHYIANSYPRQVFGEPVRPNQLCLGVCTSDTPDWTSWHAKSRFPVGTIFRSCERICVIVITIEESIQTARLIEQSAQLPTTLSSAEDAKTAQGDPKFKKTDTVLYTTSDGAEVEAEVIGVHLDDFPNIYYTIRVFGSDSERQTNENRMRKLEISNFQASTAATSESIDLAGSVDPSEIIQVTVSFQSRQIPLKLTNSTTIGALRSSIRSLTGISSRNQKLIVRGQLLPQIDHAQIKDTKIVPGCKIMLMATTK